MLRRRSLAIASALATLALGLVVGAPAADAAAVITPWQSTVAVGATMSVSANGCPLVEEETESTYTYQSAELRLLVGTSPNQRLAGFASPVSGVRQRISVPGWVDPTEDAVIVGSCRRVTYDFETDDGSEVVEQFSYAPVAIDIVAGTPAMTGPIVALSRPSAAAGQSVRASITGCEGAVYASATLLRGSDLTLEAPEYVLGDGGEVSDGSATIDLSLTTSDGEDIPTMDLASGDYLIIGSCYREDEENEALSAPVPFTVDGETPWDSITYDVGDESVSVAGTGCDGGRTVVVRSIDESFFEGVEPVRARGRAIATNDLMAAARATDANALGPDAAELEVTPAADGSWTAEVAFSEDASVMAIEASCGDPLDDGFNYLPTTLTLGGWLADVYADRVSPTSSPTGGQVAAWVVGECETGASVGLYRDGELVSSSATVMPGWTVGKQVTLTAPSTPGTYSLVSMCDGDRGDQQPYVVFTPTMRSGAAPLAAEPASGWPEQGHREMYQGRIGPIDLPAMDMDEEMATSSTKALGPSGLFIDIPRPDGDYAITQIDMNLVDADGMPVPATAAHLHHFVIANRSSKNPGCPGGSTFGLPGEIIGASGAEKTVLQLGDPYGIVVDGDDEWTGVYDLMSRSMEDQTVYLTYDITYRRDVQNVRPVSRYFGSATGCSSFTWTIDGSGSPDTQSTYIDIQKSGRLVGGGAHIHNGAMHADLVNDRGRRLCRSEIDYGTEHVGHEMPMLRRAMDTPTTTVVDEVPMEEYPPEFYDDDLAIDGISNCALAESVTKGERIRFDAVYENERPRSGVMGIYSLFVWEGGGPTEPLPPATEPPPADALQGTPHYTG